MKAKVVTPKIVSHLSFNLINRLRNKKKIENIATRSLIK